ncbi:FadR/GntR family transcriptional regulator [Streptomyces sp. ACA25]|uniref:FadR/GntR family transcriptional regulator n=1 Tax=Streptomyces sp. ACA25 TaxID=3022596 RepID=UPI002307ABA3|nr:FadR/GntR family transcriptional regulator [Streptomyces sp. ACA25]MDB1089804.1 FadR/GntR family transcriptional regulator [Streptomyces sp. ACA25]
MAVTDEAIEKVKAMIVSGALVPGQRLPREEELAAELGLSRSSLREAVRALTAMRILVARQGDGTYVSSLEPGLLLEALAFASDISRGETARDLLQVRRMLEPQATALAAGRATEDDLRALRAALDRCAAAETAEEFVVHDIEFHQRIVDLAGNAVLSALLRGLSGRTQRERVLQGVEAGSALERAQREHEAILEALTSRDARLAEATAAVHIAGVERRLGGGAALPPGGAGPEGHRAGRVGPA